MWECYKACLKAVLPGVGLITIGLIIAALIGLALATGGVAAAGAAGVAAAIGVPIVADAIGTLLGCLIKCGVDPQDDIG